MKKIYLLLILFLCLLQSCVTSAQNLGKTPSWIDNPVTIANKACYKGEGISSLKDSSLFSAYQEALTRYLLKDEDDEMLLQYAAELSDKGQTDEGHIIAEYTYIEEEDEGSYHAYVVISVDKDYANKVITSYLAEVKSREDKVFALKSESNLSYRQNNDYDALVSLLEAYNIAMEGPIESNKNQPEKLLNSAVKIINRASIGISNLKRDQATCMVTIKRNSGFFHPSIVGAKVIVDYSAYNAVNDVYDSSYSFYTNSEGSFNLSIPNAQLVTSGVLIIKLDLTDQLDQLKKNGYMEAYNAINDANVGQMISYDKSMLLKNVRIALVSLSNDIAQNPLVSEENNNIIAAIMRNNGNYVIDITPGKEEDLDKYKQEALSKNCRYLLLVKSEIQNEDVGEYSSVVVSGNISVYDVEKNSLIIEQSPYEFSANGSNLSDARNNAFDGLFKLLSVRLISHLSK